MPESERLQTLGELEAVRKELMTVLHQMPITDGTRVKSLNVRIRQMEDKVFKVERAIEKFKRPPIYVQIA